MRAQQTGESESLVQAAKSIYSKSNMGNDIDYKDQYWKIQITWQRTFDMWICFQLQEGLPQTTTQHVWHSSNTLCGFRAQNAWGQFPHLHSVIAYLGHQSRHGAMAAHPILHPMRSHRVEGVHARAISDHLCNRHTKLCYQNDIENLECRLHGVLHNLHVISNDIYLICMIRNDDY